MTSPNDQARAPDWDFEQLKVILEAPASWQLVIAGPGAGKSAVACQRVAYLVDEAVPPSRILLVSFTRTAVAELRDRIVSYAVAGDRARSVRISTIDSHAWSLRTGFDDGPLPKSLGDGSYDLGIQRTIELFRNKNPDLMDFMARLEHIIIDEAQDVMGLRADLVLEMLKSLAPTCGVTILADPAQAIYGFTTDGTDDNKPEPSLLERLPMECPRPLLDRALKNIHRVKDNALIDLFLRTRKEIEFAENAHGHLARVQEAIRETCGNDVGVTSYENIADFLAKTTDGSMLVLFRRRADVLFASSYCSQAGVEHRLRMSDVPIVVRPWLGWLLGETVQAILNQEEFDKLWESRASLCSAPFLGEERDTCWTLLHRLAAGSRPKTLDLVHLRNIVARSRPPIELCYSELGSRGPILGTIHASKGREADTVVLVMPPHQDHAEGGLDGDNAAVFEEGRVYYVGATRARKMLTTAGKSVARVGYLDSKRIYRICGERKAQLEVGRDGDVDKLAHLAWSNASRVQRTLAIHTGRTVPLRAWAVAEEDYALRLILEQKEADGVTRAIEVGQLSRSFQSDLKRLWGRIDSEGNLKPGESIPHLYLVAVATVGLAENERSAVKAPFSQSAMALAPVIKGFPMIHFLFRKTGRFSR
ncbi:UvrD-helicase domain-containing protein [Polyangium sp. y55x31]|uniref:UvrD-helicase domain-containing protein n=1 Tax=Polyangium sp. y55x31 TaxID=3042688 RepID=UPI002482C64F|nr:UvrD-helicase domain-containing protein [Polyangium sp. y55x31]